MTMPISNEVTISNEVPIAHENKIAAHLARHALIVAPVVILGAGLLRGVDAALSAAVALVIVAANFMASARLIAWGADKPAPFLQGAVLGGFLFRFAVLTAIVLLLDQLAFIDLPVLVLTIAATHFGLLLWETRYVSLTLAAPGLKPGVGERRDSEEIG